MMDKYQDLAKTRLPKALRAIRAVSDVGRACYHAPLAAREELAEAITQAADECRVRLLGKEAKPQPVPTPEPAPMQSCGIPHGLADGGGTFFGEVMWAIEAIRRKDYELAEARLLLCVKGKE